MKPPSELHLTMVRAAEKAIAGLAFGTPLVASRCLEAVAGRPIYLKLATLKPVGAFKLRGAANAPSLLDGPQRATGGQDAAIAIVALKAVRAAVGTIIKA